MDKEKSSTIASVLGLSGGILWLYGAISPIVTALGHANKVSDLWWMRDLNIIILLCLVALIFAITGIIGAVIVKPKNKTAGLMMLISAFGGIASTTMLYGTPRIEYILASILLLIAGIMAFRK